MVCRVCMTIDFQNALISRIFRVFWTEQVACQFSVCLRSNICFSLRPWQIIDRRDTDKLQYFAITEFINSFFIRSPFFRFIKHAKSLCLLGEPIRHFHTRAQFQLRMSRILYAAKHLFVGSDLQVTW